MGLFSKSKSILTEEEIRILVFHNRDSIKDLQKKIQDLDHAVLKLDGHIKSLRGSFNQFKFRNKEEPVESEVIKTSDPTDFLRGL